MGLQAVGVTAKVHSLGAAKVHSFGVARVSSPVEANLEDKEADGSKGKHETSGSAEGTVRKYASGNDEEARPGGGDQSDGKAGSGAKASCDKRRVFADMIAWSKGCVRDFTKSVLLHQALAM